MDIDLSSPLVAILTLDFDSFSVDDNRTINDQQYQQNNTTCSFQIQFLSEKGTKLLKFQVNMGDRTFLKMLLLCTFHVER